jgi:xanthine dehydrogenase accessory factor
MKELFEKILEEVTAGRNAVLVTIIASSGSTPRGAGARMVVFANGESFGTIGGGAVELRSQELAREVLEKKQSYSKGFKLAPNQVADLGMICGGDVTVYFQYFEGGDTKSIALLQKIIALFGHDKDSWIITEIGDETAWNMYVYESGEGIYGTDNNLDGAAIAPLLGNRCILKALNSRKYYTEPLVQAGRVYIFGGGHVAQELVPVLSHLDFHCVVIDDRPEFSSKALFPAAEDALLNDFSDISKSLEIRSCDYVAIMTRGHQNDYSVLVQALRSSACYIGLIGSRNKIAATFKRLTEEDGFANEDLTRIYTPIGLDIQAETPAEIAISIAGEMIQVRAARRAC